MDSQERDKKVIEHLRKIKFVGPFPKNTTALLTNLQNALDEARLVDKKLSRSDLLKILQKEEIMVFADVNDFYRWKIGARMPRKRP